MNTIISSTLIITTFILAVLFLNPLSSLFHVITTFCFTAVIITYMDARDKSKNNNKQ